MRNAKIAIETADASSNGDRKAIRRANIEARREYNIKHPEAPLTFLRKKLGNQILKYSAMFILNPITGLISLLVTSVIELFKP